MEFLEWGVAVDEQDGVVGGELGHGGEAAGRVLGCHGFSPRKMNHIRQDQFTDGNRLCCG